MKFCPHCGESISDPGFQFCMSCGQRLPQADAAEQAAPAEKQPAAPAVPADATTQFVPVGTQPKQHTPAQSAPARQATRPVPQATPQAAPQSAAPKPAATVAPQPQAATPPQRTPAKDLFGQEGEALPDDLFAGETNAPTATTLFKVNTPPAQDDFFQKDSAAQAQARPAQAPPVQAPPAAEKPQPPVQPVPGPQTEPVRVSQIQQRLMEGENELPAPLRRPPAQRQVPPPPPIDLPGYDDEEDEEEYRPRSGGRVAVTIVAIVLLFALVTAGVTMVILYSSNRASKLVDSFIESIETGAQETEDAKRLANLQEIANDGKLRLDGVSPTTEGWAAFFAEFEQPTSRNELKSQLLAQSSDSNYSGQYPAVTIESEKLFLFVKKYKIVINGASLLAPDAQDGSTILLNGAPQSGYMAADGMQVDGLMPGRYECRVVAPGTDSAAAIPVEISIFQYPGTTALESSQFYADITVGNCRSDDAIVYVNGNPVMETPQDGAISLTHISLGSTIRIEVIEEGEKLAADLTFSSPNETALNFGEYYKVDGEPPAEDEDSEGEDEKEDASDSSEDSVKVSASEADLNSLLTTFYTSYLNCINDQSMDSIQLTTSTANSAISSRITASGNASNLFQFSSAAVKYSSAKQTERNGKTYLEFNAQFKYKYKPREGEGEYTDGSNYQSVQLVFQDGKWLVNQMVMVNANDYNTDTFATFS